MRWSAARTAALTLMVLLPIAGSAGTAASPLDPVDADADHPVFAGLVAGAASRRAERIEILLAVRDGSATSDAQAVTSAVLRAVHRVLPGVPAVDLRGTPMPARMLYPGGSYGGLVRISLGPIDTPELRSTIVALTDAVNHIDGVPRASVEIAAVSRGYAVCKPLQLQRADAQGRVAELARAAGAQSTAAASLELAPTKRILIDGPALDRPLCGETDHVRRPTSIELPTGVVSVEAQRYRFAARSTFRMPPPQAQDPVAPLFTAASDGVRLLLHTSGPILTVESVGAVSPSVDGTLYEYRGPDARFLPAGATAAAFTRIRTEIVRRGVSDANIVTQIDPASGRWYVLARSARTSVDAAIVTAIAGSDEHERRVVTTAPFGDGCASTDRAVEHAVAQAAMRVQRIATALRTSVDTHPVAVALEYGSGDEPCSRRSANTVPMPEERHLAGTLASWRSDAVSVAMLVSFRISPPNLAGRFDERTADDDANGYASRFGFTPLPVDYPGAGASGEAALEKKLSPQRVRAFVRLDPDNANGFRPIDPGIVATLATKLELRENEYQAAFIPGFAAPASNGQQSEALLFDATLPYRGAATIGALTSALSSFSAIGYGGFMLTPESDACDRIATMLARDAIRAAASRAHSARNARLIAIDLRGPFTVDGTCDSTTSAPAQFNIKAITIPDVRLAAYARVSYAR